MSPGVKIYFRVKAKKIWRKTAILKRREVMFYRDRPVRKPLSSQTAETWGFYYWSLGVCLSPGCTGPVPNLSSVIYPQAVGNYGSLGVCGLRTAAEDQRAPGRRSRTTVLGPWRSLFVGVWEFACREKRLPCVRLGRKPRYMQVHLALQTSYARHFVVVILVPFRYLSYYVSTLLILT